MKRIEELILNIINGMKKAAARFPLTVLSLIGATGLICYMISLRAQPSLLIQKLMFTFLVGAVLGMAAQFAIERFSKLEKQRLMVYGLSAVLTAGYFLILWPAPQISAEIGIRTFVAVFALVCTVLWVPSFKSKADFNSVALVNFKSAFTSVLYSGVLSAGIAAIIAAIDILLFRVNTDSYGYMMAIVWVLFAPIYYLSLLPWFNSEDEEDIRRASHAALYPKFLEILVSYIAIPLVAAYTVVLIAYFAKILITMTWPSGQLGVMVLAYSAAGLLIYVLSSLLDNQFSVLYRRVFPKVLIPVVIMQLISVGIRLNAYGVTESRYYVALFGVFSITTAIVLSFKPISRNGIIALLAAGFAIVSIIPPADAFTVSRISQITRVENILQAEGILSDGKLIPKANVSEKVKVETTSILSYLDTGSSLKYVKWLPADFKLYEDMKVTLGFDQTYPGANPSSQYFYASINAQVPLDISGFDTSIVTYSNRNDKSGQPTFDLMIGGISYKMQINRVSNLETRISILNDQGTELIGTGLYDFAKKVTAIGGPTKESLPPSDMTLNVTKDGYKLRIIFQNINGTSGNTVDTGMDYTMYVLFAAPSPIK